MNKKPNILLLIDDEHRADLLRIEGNKTVRTPNLDQVIDDGTYFRNAYTPAPICVPARQSFLSGLYPRNCQCLDFGQAMPSDILTIPQHLSDCGYYTVAAGKMHFQGPDQMHGWNERIGRGIKSSYGFGKNFSVVKPVKTKIEIGKPVPGTGKWSTAEEIKNARAGDGYWMQHDRYSVDGALQFLEEYFTGKFYYDSANTPLLLAVSLVCPHYPYQCPPDLFSYYLRRTLPYVETLPDLFDCHEFFKVEVGRDVSFRQAHRATAAYYGMIEWVDQEFGRVIKKLRDLTVLDDFAIIFLSDHGEMLGQKGLWEKQQFFEASVRVPFSISLPRHTADFKPVVRDNVSLIDLFPTICSIADVPIPEGLDGQSLLALMEGRTPQRRNLVYSELYHPYNGPAVMVKHQQLKYFRFQDKGWPEQLFDLSKDPDEEHNLIEDPYYAKELHDLKARIEEFGPSPKLRDNR